jgi:methylthioxylose transferase
MSPSSADVRTAPQPVGRARWWAPPLAVLLVAGVVAGTAAVGERLAESGVTLHLLGGYVLRGTPIEDVVLDRRVLLPLVVGLAGVLWGPVLAARARWWVLLCGSAVASAGWAVSLAVISDGWKTEGGWERLREPLSSVYEYPNDVGRVGSVGELLQTFNQFVPADSADPWTTHVSGHPPAALLAFVFLDRLGLDGLGWAAAMCVLGGALAVPAVLVTVRAIGGLGGGDGESTARVVAPFVVLAPTALWVATSADALFAGVAAWGVALLAVGAARERGRGADAAAVAGGLVLGLALFLSFGLTSLGLLALGVVLVHARRLGRSGAVRVLGLAAGGVLVVFAVFTLGGYWWFEGLGAAADRVRSGPSYADRPLAFFLVANLAAAAVAAGPAAVAGLGALRWVRLAVVPLAVLAGMLVSDLTGLVRGETERIWLPFTVWLPVAAAFLPERQRRWWLAASVLVAVAVEVSQRLEW